MDLAIFTGNNLSIIALVVLLIVSFFASIMSALAGFGGGVMLLAVMAKIMNPIELIAIHGLIQMGSNISRIIFNHLEISFRFVIQFIIGAIPGVVLASLLVSLVSTEMMMTYVAIFILLTAWVPFELPIKNSKKHIPIIGTMVMFISMFIGSTGPILAPIFRSLKFSKTSFVSTMAVCLLGQNIFKISALSILGFDILAWLPFIALMVSVGIFATWIGSKLRQKVNEKHFLLLVKIVMTLLALNIIRGLIF